MSKPNVLWISTHDINPHLGCYSGVWPGAERAHTPNLDELANGGVRYDYAFATTPVCGPSRSAIMTGCFPTAIGTMHMRTKAVPPPEVRLLSEYFRGAGYYTTCNGSTDFQVQVPPTAFDECSTSAHWRGRPSDDTPFFAAFHGGITHESRIYVDDEEFLSSTAHVPDEYRQDPASIEVPPYHPNTEVFRKAWARYFDLICEMDYWVGEILTELDEDGLADNTIVVFWSDHGLGMPRAKRWACESGLREPLIVRWPAKVTVGQRRSELVHLMDLAPTMLNACSLAVPSYMHGRPFMDADGRLLAGNSHVFGGRDRMDEQEDRARTVRNGRFRYIRNFHPDRPPMQYCYYPDHFDTWDELRRLTKTEATEVGQGLMPNHLTDLQRSVIGPDKPAEELYDLVADPHETRNLIADGSVTVVLDELRTALDAWIDQYGDLGELRERDLLERWRPGGVAQKTAAPVLTVTDGAVNADCLTEGASIGWTDVPPGGDVAVSDIQRFLGSPINDGRGWNLYTGPVHGAQGVTLWFRAWRIGFDPSDETAFDAVLE